MASRLSADESRVGSMPDLRAAVAKASPGDKIIVADGKYTNDDTIEIAVAGTHEAPIEIVAATVGGAEIGGSVGFTFTPKAAYVVLRGFKLSHEAGTLDLPAGTHHCRVTRNHFELKVPRRGAYMVVSGDDHEIDYNAFANKATEGQMLYIQGPRGRAMAQRTWIHHNHFRNFENSRRNNSSALHIGHSSRSLSPAHSIVEYNLFSRTRGENEGAVCNKSCDNIYRFNTFAKDCTELSLRHGNRCLVYGNFFMGTRGGLRFFGDDHRIFSNYFQGNSPAVQIGNGGANVPPAELTSHDRPDRVQFVFNTLVDNWPHVIMRHRQSGLGAAHFVFANNLIQGGRDAVSIDGPLSDATWKGNVVWPAQAANGGFPTGGLKSYDPKLRKSADGIYRLEPNSRAIGRAVGSYSYVEVDINSHARSEPLDVGAQEFSTAAPVNRILTPRDVGLYAP